MLTLASEVSTPAEVRSMPTVKNFEAYSESVGQEEEDSSPEGVGSALMKFLSVPYWPATTVMTVVAVAFL